MSKKEQEVNGNGEVSIGTLFENSPLIGTLDIPVPEVEIGVLEIPPEVETGAVENQK